MFIKPSQ